MVLLWIEHLQQRRRGITPKVSAHFVYFVQHKDRVERFRAPHGLDDAAWQRTDVGTPVSSDLCLVSDAAQGYAHKLATQRLRNGPTQRGLARTWRADKAKNGATHLVSGQLAYSHILQNALFGLFQPIVAVVQHFGSRFYVLIVLRRLGPGQIEDPIQVGADDTSLWCKGRHSRQPGEFFFRFLLHFLRQSLVCQSLAQFLDLLSMGIRLTQFGLDGLHLLPQKVLSLGFINLLLHLGVDLVLQFQHVQLFGQQNAQAFQSLNRFQDAKQVLALLRIQVYGRGHQIGQPTGFVYVHSQHVGIL